MTHNLPKVTLRAFFIVFTLLFSLIGKSQDFQWVRQIKGIYHDYNEFAKSSDVDNEGNSYTVGTSASPYFDLDPTIQGTEIIDNSNIQNFTGTYIIKVDKDGNYLWGKTFGTVKRGDQAIGVKIGTDGNIYVLLILQELNSNNLGIMDSFFTIIKIAPNGNIISTKKIQQNYGYNNNMYAYSFDIDKQNNIFISGYFIGNITLNSSIPNLNLNTNRIDYFILKINGNNNEINWGKQFNISYNTDCKIMIRPDGDINVLLNIGDDYSLYNINQTDGTTIWKKDFINQNIRNFHVSEFGIQLLCDKAYFNTVDIDPSTSVKSISGNSAYIIFLNLDGNFIDVKEFTKPTDGDIIFSAGTTDNDGNYFFGAQFKGSIDLDPSDKLFKITSNGYDAEAFYLKLDSNRNFDSVIKFGSENPISNNYNNCYYLKIENIKIVDKNNYLTGDFMWTCDFDPSTNSVYNLKTVNQVTINRDGFILKLGPCDPTVPNGDKNQYFCSKQNPKISNLTPNSNSIKWYDSLTSTNQLNSSIPVINGHTYYATRKIGSCPESPRLAVTVHINQSPNVPIITSPVFCKNENAKLLDIITNGVNVNWYDSLTNSIQLTKTTVLENGFTYYASQTENGCESERIPITAIINESTQPTTTSLQTFCFQQNATINNIAITGQNIKWYDAQTNGNLLPNTTALQNGISYYASQTISGCESERKAVLVNIQNTAAPTGDTNQSFCSTQHATLNDIEITGTNIKWYNNSNLELSNTTLISNNTTYYATQTINNCESVNKLSINTTLINTLNANNYTVEFCDDNNDGKETINLSLYNQELIVNSTANNFSYYSSLLAAENQTSSSKINNFNNYILTVGSRTLFVRIDSPNGCHQVVALNLNLYSKPTIPIDNIMPICEGSSITVNAGTGYDNYLWSTGETSATITIQNPGDYSVTVTNDYDLISCSTTQDFTVKKSTVATINSIETQDWTDNQNTIKVFVTGEGDFEYSIDGIHFQDSNEFSNVISGQYNVLVRDKNGCGTVTDEVYLLMYPKFFTPNGDGYNDTWKIKFSDSEKNLTIKIFDRYGKLLKEILPGASWNGQFNNQELPASDYWFIVTRANGKEYKGHFSLKR